MKKLTKIFATLLAVALVASSFAACRLVRDADEVNQIRDQKKMEAQAKEMMEATAVTINDDIVVSGAYYGYFYSNQYSMEYNALSQAAEAEAAAASDAAATSDAEASEASSASSAAPEIVVDKAAVKQAAIDDIIAIKTAYAKALEANITLTTEDNKNINDQVASIQSQATSQGIPYYDMLTMMGTNAETVEQIVREQYMGNLYYASLVADKYVTAKHILVMYTTEPTGESDGETAGRTKEESKAVIDDVKAQLDGGADFDTLMNEKSEDNPTVNTQYTFAKGEMDPAFEEAAFALEAGKTSGIIESTYGYHIIKRLDTSLSGIAAALGSSQDPEVADVINAETETLKSSAKFAEHEEIIAYYDGLYI